MKNLFKNLMLVAVAAMAFTACTKENNEVNAVTKKVVLEFVADLADDDTRVAFGEQDGKKYPAIWEAYDNVTVKVGDKQAWYTLTEEDVLESGKKAIIRPEFVLLEGETLSGDIVATVNEDVYFDNHQGNKPTISLKAEAVYPATTLAFEHQYAYGKMELAGLPAEFNVTEVKLNLVGGGKELNHTISGYSVEDNIFWFTTEAMEAVESFAVYASNGAETYYKEVTVEKAFAFEVGKISAFRVNDLVVKPADFNVQLTKITSMSDNVIRFEGDNAEDNITISFNPGLETLAAGHYDAVMKDWGNFGQWAWTGATALEVADEFEGSSVDVNAAGGGAWYYSHNGVDVTVDSDVYTIVAHLQNYTSSGNQTVDFTYVGKLEVAGSGSESEEPFADNIATDLSFNNDGDLVFVVDAYETFKVRLNSANRPNNTTIKEGEYAGINSSTVANGQFSVSQKIKGGFLEGWSSTKTTSTMTVEYVDGQYLIIVDYISAWGGSGEVGYKGVPDGWDQPVADTTPVIKLDTTSVELKRAGGSVDVNVTLKNITESIVAVSDNAQFTTSVNGNVVTISALDENNTGADIDGIVTISAGGVSAQVTVKQLAEDVVTEVTWNYVVDSSTTGVFGHIWNVSGIDLDGYPVSAQITMDSRNGYTSSSHFTAGTYNYHAQYADGNFGDGMWFTMRNIDFRGNQYSNYDVTGTITVEIEGGRTKITADIYNYVNNYQTTKITTFVGYLN